MFLSDFIEAVKSDRKLSFRNWRYRLLHCPSIEIVSPEQEVVEANL